MRATTGPGYRDNGCNGDNLYEMTERDTVARNIKYEYRWKSGGARESNRVARSGITNRREIWAIKARGSNRL